MSALLQVGEHQIGPDEIIALLTSPEILPHLLRELVLSRALANITYTPEEWSQDYDRLSQQPEYQHLPPSQIEAIAPRLLKIEKFKKITWGNQIEAQFSEQQERFDRVLFSLIQTEDVEVAQELYFRLQEGEFTFPDLAHRYSKGPEALSNGLVGPMELQNLHPKLAQILRISQPGQISPPLRVDQWIVIVRLDRYIPAELSPQLRQRLLNEQFDIWLQQKIAQESALITIETENKISPSLVTKNNEFAPILDIEPEVITTTNFNPNPLLPANQGETQGSVELKTEDKPLPRTEELAPHAQGENNLLSLLSSLPDSPQIPDRVLPRELMRELHKRRQTVRIPESLLISLIPIALGAWAVGAYVNFQKTSPTPVMVNKATIKQEIVPKEKSFHTAVNKALMAAKLTQTAQTSEEWDRVVQHWQQAIDLMGIVPPQNPKYRTARQKIQEYGKYLNYAQQKVNSSRETFRVAVKNAESAVSFGKQAKSQQDWHQTANQWEKAIAFMQSINQDSPHYSIAQRKATEYQAYLDYAQRKASK